MRILYVEDEKLLADAVTHLMKKSNIDVDWAEDGEEGLRLAKKPIYDAIVLDNSNMTIPEQKAWLLEQYHRAAGED